MSKQRLMRLLSLLFAFSLVAAACGGGDDDAADTENGGGGAIDGGAAQDAVDRALGDDDDDDDDDDDPADGDMVVPASMEELEALWAEKRQEVVDRINAEGFGLGEDGIVTGAGGFEIDTNDCPADWSDTEGIGDTIKIGHTTAKSGNLAAYGNIADGMDSYFDYVNENGGIDGKMIDMIVKDDSYVATQTIELVDELLQSDRPFTIWTLGSPNSLAVYGTLNEKCVPHPLMMTGHPAWGDPVVHPWSTGNQMSYSTEAILWGAWIKANMADRLPVKIVGLVMENDFGLAYEDGMKTYADANPDVVAEFVAVRHEPAAPTVTNEMTTIAAANPDVFISMTAGNPCLLAVEESARAGMTGGDIVMFAPSVCKDASAFMIPAGDAGDGWLIVGGGLKVSTDPQYADDPWISFMNETMEADSLDITNGNYGTGFSLFAWPMVEILRVTAELEGGLTRTNFITASRHFSSVHPGLLDGIQFSMDGNNDAYYIEGSDFARYDAASTSWLQEGDVVDLTGSSPNCNWGPSGCR